MPESKLLSISLQHSLSSNHNRYDLALISLCQTCHRRNFCFVHDRSLIKIPLPAASLLLCQTKATLQSPHDPPLSVSHLNICLHFAKLHYQPPLFINMQCSDSLILPLQCCNTQVLFSGIFTFSGIFFVFLPNFLGSSFWKT